MNRPHQKPSSSGGFYTQSKQKKLNDDKSKHSLSRSLSSSSPSLLISPFQDPLRRVVEADKFPKKPQFEKLFEERVLKEDRILKKEKIQYEHFDDPSLTSKSHFLRSCEVSMGFSRPASRQNIDSLMASISQNRPQSPANDLEVQKNSRSSLRDSPITVFIERVKSKDKQDSEFSPYRRECSHESIPETLCSPQPLYSSFANLRPMTPPDNLNHNVSSMHITNGTISSPLSSPSADILHHILRPKQKMQDAVSQTMPPILIRKAFNNLNEYQEWLDIEMEPIFKEMRKSVMKSRPEDILSFISEYASNISNKKPIPETWPKSALESSLLDTTKTTRRSSRNSKEMEEYIPVLKSRRGSININKDFEDTDMFFKSYVDKEVK